MIWIWRPLEASACGVIPLPGCRARGQGPPPPRTRGRPLATLRAGSRCGAWRQQVARRSPIHQPSEHRLRGRPRCSPPPTPSYRTCPARPPQREDPTSSTVGRGWRRGCGVSSSSASDRDDGGEQRRRLTREDGGEGEGCCVVDPSTLFYRREYNILPLCSSNFSIHLRNKHVINISA